MAIGITLCISDRQEPDPSDRTRRHAEPDDPLFYFTDRGVIVEHGPPVTFFTEAKDPRTKKFLSKILQGKLGTRKTAASPFAAMTGLGRDPSGSPDRTGVCRAGRRAPSECEMVRGPAFRSPDQPDQERTTAYRDSSGPQSRSDAHCATIVGSWEESLGNARLRVALTASSFRADGRPGWLFLGSTVRRPRQVNVLRAGAVGQGDACSVLNQGRLT